jgi:hypothetical protein
MSAFSGSGRLELSSSKANHEKTKGWLPGTVSHIRRGQKRIRPIPPNLDEKRGEREQSSKLKTSLIVDSLFSLVAENQAFRLVDASARFAR